MDTTIKHVTTGTRKRIALVAHDHKKDDLMRWVSENLEMLRGHDLCGTGTTSTLIREHFGLDVKGYLSGPIGGDQQLGAAIANLEIDILIFFWDPLEAQPHDPDVRALLRIAVLYDVIVATNPATADFVFTSPWIERPYRRSAIHPDVNLRQRVEVLNKQEELVHWDEEDV